MPTKPYPFQRTDILRAGRKFKLRVWFAHSMGLGKSFMALRSREKFLPHGHLTIIVCPAGLKYNWENEISLHTNSICQILSGMKSYPIRKKPDRILIISYNLLGDINDPNSWVRVLKRLKPKCIIADEVHYTQNLQAQRSVAFEYLCRKVPKLMWLSGTPVLNRTVDLYLPLKILMPKRIPSFRKFAFRYSRPRLSFGKWNYSTPKNKGKLHSLMKRYCLIRRLKEDVLDQLPPKIISVVPTVLPPKEAKIYEEAEKGAIRAIKDSYSKPNKRFKDARGQITGLKNLIGDLKYPVACEWIDNFLQQTEEKLLVFGIRRENLKKLHARYKNSVLTIGGISEKDRERNRARFKTDPKCRINFGNMDADGIGWNATVANTVLFVELGWNPAKHAQAMDRVHRIGQTKQCSIYFLVVKGSIEERIAKINDHKQKISDDVIDGGHSDDKPSVDIYSLLIKSYLKHEFVSTTKNIQPESEKKKGKNLSGSSLCEGTSPENKTQIQGANRQNRRHHRNRS